MVKARLLYIFFVIPLSGSTALTDEKSNLDKLFQADVNISKVKVLRSDLSSCLKPLENTDDGKKLLNFFEIAAIETAGNSVCVKSGSSHDSTKNAANQSLEVLARAYGPEMMHDLYRENLHQIALAYAFQLAVAAPHGDDSDDPIIAGKKSHWKEIIQILCGKGDFAKGQKCEDADQMELETFLNANYVNLLVTRLKLAISDDLRAGQMNASITQLNHDLDQMKNYYTKKLLRHDVNTHTAHFTLVDEVEAVPDPKAKWIWENYYYHDIKKLMASAGGLYFSSDALQSKIKPFINYDDAILNGADKLNDGEIEIPHHGIVSKDDISAARSEAFKVIVARSKDLHFLVTRNEPDFNRVELPDPNSKILSDSPEAVEDFMMFNPIATMQVLLNNPKYSHLACATLIDLSKRNQLRNLMNGIAVTAGSIAAVEWLTGGFATIPVVGTALSRGVISVGAGTAIMGSLFEYVNALQDYQMTKGMNWSSGGIPKSFIEMEIARNRESSVRGKLMATGGGLVAFEAAGFFPFLQFIREPMLLKRLSGLTKRP